MTISLYARRRGSQRVLYIDDQQIKVAARLDLLLLALRNAFENAGAIPHRVHEDLPGDDGAKLLIMPYWAAREAIGVKIVTYVPSNGAWGRPTIDGVYVLMNGQTGEPLAILSARALTNVRTAAVSALAASVLSRGDAKTLLMIGTGALAPHLIEAHLGVRPIERVILWGRDSAKARDLARRLEHLPVGVDVATDLSAVLGCADIISSATSSREPLIEGRLVAPGTHIDLVGGFAPDMREADLDLFRKGRVFVDTKMAFEESGDLISPLREGLIDQQGTDLSTILKARDGVRRDPSEITIFKSVGTSLADLAAARQIVSHCGMVMDSGIG